MPRTAIQRPYLTNSFPNRELRSGFQKLSRNSAEMIRSSLCVPPKHRFPLSSLGMPSFAKATTAKATVTGEIILRNQHNNMKNLVTICIATALFFSWTAVADISVDDLSLASRVIGRLGQPLGSRLVIEGVRAERLKLQNPLQVTIVNGEALTRAVPIRINHEIEIQEGVIYRFEGYESGAFEGAPVWDPKDPLPAMTFQFHSFFVVTKILSVPSK